VRIPSAELRHLVDREIVAPFTIPVTTIAGMNVEI
jgi:hypothetical protein